MYERLRYNSSEADWNDKELELKEFGMHDLVTNL